MDDLTTEEVRATFTVTIKLIEAGYTVDAGHHLVGTTVKRPGDGLSLDWKPNQGAKSLEGPA